MRMKFGVAFAFLALSLPVSAGQLEVGVYGGANTVAHNVATLSKGGTSVTYVPGWLGKPLDAPPYYGVQAIYWSDSIADWGVGLDFSHAKAYADLSDPILASHFSVLEFTDGLNQLTANVFHKWDFDNGVRPYVGAGAGIGIPHVEITTTAANPIGPSTTFEYQVTGAVLQGIAGVSYEFADNWRVFAEYKLAYQWNDAHLTGGGTFSNQFVTQHFLAGLSYSFDAGGY